MRKTPLLYVFVAALLAFALAGCSNEGENDATPASQTVDKETLIGFWELDAGDTVGFEGYLSLDESDTCEYAIGDTALTGTWTVEDGKATISLEDDLTLEVGYTGEKVVLGSSDSTRLVFSKGDLESYLERVSGDGSKSSEAESGESASAAAADPAEDADDEEGDGIVDEVIEDIAPVAIVDDASYAIVVTGKGTDYTNDPCYRFTFTNKTDRAVNLVCDDEFTIGDKKVGAGLDEIADPGETLEGELYFTRDDLGGGAELLANVNGTISVLADETSEPLAAYPFHMD